MEGTGESLFFPSLLPIVPFAAIVSLSAHASFESQCRLFIANRELNRLFYHNWKSHNSDPEKGGGTRLIFGNGCFNKAIYWQSL